ncbi:MAG TPA: hypothetical protein VK989_05685, partial [Polyangia bacterium]|nr:hypothetical protein [Polyangia bacterium]
MSVSPWVYAAGAAAVLVGGLVVAGQSAASSPAAPSPTPANPAAPIRITSGHRYEVTLTFGGPTTAAALLASIVPNLQVGLNTVAPNAYAFVHASAPNDRQVVYVVDAIAPPPGSTYAESPQTFQADLNAASMGGISVAVLDLGPSPISAPAPPPTGSPGPLTPPSPAPAGPLAPSSPVSDPALVSMAQSALAALITAGALTSPGGPVIVNGNPSDPATVAALVAYQNQTLLPAQRSGQLDYLTFGAAVTSALVHTGDPSKVGTDATITDAPTLTLAQTQLAAAIGRGFFPNIDYGAAQASGASDAAWQAAWTAAATQFNATAGKAILPTNGTLDRIGLAVILPFASLPLTLPDGTPIATPASPVTDFAEIGMA